MSEARALPGAAARLADTMAADSARVADLEVFAHTHAGLLGGVFLCTSSTRPASPSEGFTIYEADTNLYRYWDGAAWITVLDPAASRIYTAKGTLTAANSSNVTLTNIVGLSFAVASGQMYQFKFSGLYQTAAINTGISFSFSGPATTYAAWTMQVEIAAAGTDQMFTASATALTSVLTTPSVVAANTSYWWTIDGFVQPSAAGTLQARWRSEVNGSNATIMAGSTGILTLIA